MNPITPLKPSKGEGNFAKGKVCRKATEFIKFGKFENSPRGPLKIPMGLGYED